MPEPSLAADRPVLTFKLEGDLVEQSGGHRFHPEDWGAFVRGSLVVRAVRIPGPFRVGPEVCKNGYLVKDDRGLVAISVDTFTRDYRPLASVVDPNPEDAEPGEWSAAA